MSIEFDRGSPGKFDSRTLSRKTLSRWTGRTSNATLAIWRGYEHVVIDIQDVMYDIIV